MAARRVSDLLKDLTLKDVAPVKNGELGRGAYGKVFAVNYQGSVYAAKQIHAALLDGVTHEEKSEIKDRFIKECYHSSMIHHPNIVRFIGVYYPKGSDLPIMVMELMDANITKFVQKNKQNISISTKISILYDVSLGLRYLHNDFNPPFIHRDLSSNNVLLTSHLVAKISDLGMAKMIRADSKQTRSRLTTAPGTLHFMPPEALDEDYPVYSTPVDVFSFAGVALHLFSEEWPTPSHQKKQDPKTGKLVALSEAQRRQQYLDKMTAIGEELTVLNEYIERCLDDNPDQRPTIGEVSVVIEIIKEVYTSYVLNIVYLAIYSYAY